MEMTKDQALRELNEILDSLEVSLEASVDKQTRGLTIINIDLIKQEIMRIKEL